MKRFFRGAGRRGMSFAKHRKGMFIAAAVTLLVVFLSPKLKELVEQKIREWFPGVAP